MHDQVDTSRRRFIATGLGLAVGACIASPALAMPRAVKPRMLAFHNLHTDERLRVTYWQNGAYNRRAMAKINDILRDHRTGDVHPINVSLIELLYDMQTRIDNDGTIEIISGYRSPHSNSLLRSVSSGVARHSYHMKGMAIDLRIPGLPLAQLHTMALNMRGGGVGYYPNSSFVHMDVGPVRRW